jgi:ATP-dependent RNA helicase DeaD
VLVVRITVLTNFNEFNLSSELLSSIADMGFTAASEIQAKTIPYLLEGKDLIGQAQTGTGKTAAFAIPCIEKIERDSDLTQALILCPTRELVVQVAGELKKLTKDQKDISVLAIYGGQDISIQLKALKKGVQVVVGTPGRIMDHMRRSTLKLNNLNYLVFDEADQMLDMGFREDMETILQETPKDRQTVMFSATIPKDLMLLMKKFQNNPVHVNTIGKNAQSKQINQFYYHINNASKLSALKRLLAFHKINSALIFCNTKLKVDELSKELADAKYSTAALHGDIDQKKRDRVMQEFRQGRVQLLIATDVAARGIDVNDLEAVINYDLPRFDQDYVHRIGRTGRAGKAGLALSLVTGRESEHINRIARKTNMKIESAEVPSAIDLEKVNFENIKHQIQATKFNRKKDLFKYQTLVSELELFEYSAEEVAAVLLKSMLDQFETKAEQETNFEPERNSGRRNNFLSPKKQKNFKNHKRSSQASKFKRQKTQRVGV